MLVKQITEQEKEQLKKVIKIEVVNASELKTTPETIGLCKCYAEMYDLADNETETFENINDYFMKTERKMFEQEREYTLQEGRTLKESKDFSKGIQKAIANIKEKIAM